MCPYLVFEPHANFFHLRCPPFSINSHLTNITHSVRRTQNPTHGQLLCIQADKKKQKLLCIQAWENPTQLTSCESFSHKSPLFPPSNAEAYIDGRYVICNAPIIGTVISKVIPRSPAWKGHLRTTFVVHPWMESPCVCYDVILVVVINMHSQGFAI